MPLILLLLLCMHPLQATQDLSTKGGDHTIDTAPVVDYQPIDEKGVDKFEEYLLMLQKKCSETEKIKKGVVLLVGTMGSGKSTLTCHLLGLSLVGVPTNDDNGWDDEGDQSICGGAIDIDPNNPPKFPVPKIGHNTALPQTFLPGVFANPNDQNGLHYCDMPGFYDKRGKAEKAISAIAPALVLHSMQRIQSVLAVVSYDSITAGKGDIFLKVIIDMMTYFGHAPWDSIQKATFVCITKCAHVSNSTVVNTLKQQIAAVDQALAKCNQTNNQDLKLHNSKEINLDKHEKTDYEHILELQADFFSIFAKIDTATKEIVLDKKKLLFSRPLHNNREAYRTKIIEALKTSPGLERDHLSKCDYSNLTLTNQLREIVNRMGGLLSKREDLKRQNDSLQKSISNKQGIPKQIKDLKMQISAKSRELAKESTNTSLVVIYESGNYRRTFSGKEKFQNWGYGAVGATIGLGVGVGAAAAVATAGGAIAAVATTTTAVKDVTAATAGKAADVVGLTLFTAVSGTAGAGAVAGGVQGGVDQNKTMLGGAWEGFKGFGSSIATHAKNTYRNTRPNASFLYEAFEPVCKMCARYGPGTFKSTNFDGWKVNEASDILTNFTYEPTNVSVNYPVAYVFEYMGYFHTNGQCKIKLYAKYNELPLTKKRIQNLKKSVNSMSGTVKDLEKEKELKMKSIARNTKEIKRLDRYITNTYEKRAKDQDIAYARAKCQMLAFFASKPLFNKGAAMPKVNDDNDEKMEEEALAKEEKETDHPLLAEMHRCIKQWKAWLRLAQAKSNENKLNDYQSDDDDEVFDID